MSSLFSKFHKVSSAPAPLPWEDDAIILDCDDMSDFNEDNILPVSTEKQVEIRKWLRPTGYCDEGGEFKKHLASHLENTGIWLLHAPAYKQWHTSEDEGILWITGIPGSGKSVVAATLIDHLRKEKVPVLYFFFRQIIDANHVPQAALRDWLDQILPYSPPLQVKLAQYLKQSRSLESLSGADFWALLRTAMRYLPRAYCVVDALDEIDDGQDMLDFLDGLSRLGTWRPSQIKIVMTSRPVPRLQTALRDTPTVGLGLKENMVDQDIATFVQYMIEKSSLAEQYHDDIRKAVPGNANGLFLYAKLAMDAFLEPGADPQQVLRNLPTDLNVMYDDLLREHNRRTEIPPDLQLLIMRSVTHASRPLRLLELADMINATQFSDGGRDLGKAKDLVRTACGPLLEILPDETVSVIHHSLTEFVKGSTRKPSEYDYPVLESGITHHRLALACLSYLQSGCFNDVPSPTRPPTGRKGRPRGSPLAISYGQISPYSGMSAFTGYAATNWYVHVRKSMLGGYDQSQINTALDHFVASKDFDKWLHLENIGCDQVTPLFVAVALGLTQYCARLVSRANSNANRGDQYEPPLYHAAKNGYDDIVTVLLRHGADVNEWDEDGYRALHIAAMHNHPNVVGILLRAGADPFCTPEKTGRFYDWGLEPKGTPVSKACSFGHVDAVAEMLPYLKTEAAVNDALFVAIDHKQSDVVALLLKHPLANANHTKKSKKSRKSRKRSGAQPLLYLACSKRDVRSIKMLLEAGAEPNTMLERCEDTWAFREVPEGSGYTAVHALASAGTLHTAGFYSSSTSDKPVEEIMEAFELLLMAGADPHQIDPEGQNALFHACDGVTARILLDANVNHNLVNMAGENLLHCHHNLDVIRHLLERAKIDTTLRVPYQQTTPLLKSLQDGLVEKALLLLEFGADCTGCDREGHGAFHLAVGINFHDKLKGLQGSLFAQLRAAGADVNMRNKAGCTPLHTLDFRNFDDEVFALLLGAGLDTEAKNSGGETALFVALKNCSDYDIPKICDKMVTAGCNLHATDNEGRNLLHALKTTDAKVIQYLTEKGLDHMHADNEGNTLWHVTAELRFSTKLFEKLRELKLDPEQPNHAGRTPLHVLSSLRPHALDGYSFNVSGTQTSGKTPFDEFLSYITQINPIDAVGVTPLHLASTFSEYLTKRLLAVGADLFRRTGDGLTVFHIAARSRQPNILGVLFEFCKISEPSHDLSTTLNAEDRLKRTAMFYACASGCVETVRMLIEAGAHVDTGRYEGSAWQGCVAFEVENKNWEYGYRADGRDYDWSAPRAGGVTIEAKTRPNVREAHQNYSGFKHRINEITRMLSSHQNFTEEILLTALEDAVRCGLDYTVECLTKVQTKLNITMSQQLTDEVNSCLTRRFQVIPTKSRFYACWENRKFDLAVDQLIEDGPIPDVIFRKFPIHQLVHNGFVSILEKTMTPEIAQKFDDIDGIREQLDPSRRSGSAFIGPLLITACQRDLPNMDMIRFLVEKMGVNVNAQMTPNRKSSGEVDKHTALHYLVHGLNWWQTRQALPYLLSKGAMVDLKDSNDVTPLRVSLNRMQTILADKYPIAILVSAGANVNSVDTQYGRRGISCLSQVAEDAGMTKYLLEHGALVNHFDIRTAISKGRCDVLELLLSYGGDANGRDTQGAEFDDGSTFGFAPRGIDSPRARKIEAMFPLHYLCIVSTEVGIGEEMATVLLRHGADINARYEGTTVMHCILYNSRIARSLLIHPDVNIEATDAEGCTLLLAAGQEQDSTQNKDTLQDTETSLVQLLVSRGANIRARDNSGKNLLHEMLSDPAKRGGSSYSRRVPHRNVDVKYIASLASALVHEQDVLGNTPLHYAAKKHIHLVTDLLDAGATPQTKNNKGNTALHYVMRGEWIVNVAEEVLGLRRQLVERLLDMGADIHARNSRKETPIFGFFRYATVWPYEQARRQAFYRERLLLEAPVYDLFDKMGIRWSDVDIDSQSLLHIVAATGRSGFRDNALFRFKFLLGKGLDVAAEDKWRRTPLDIAAGQQNEEILALYKKEGIEIIPRSERPGREAVGQVFGNDLFD